MLNTILFDLDGTLVPFLQDEFIRDYFKALTVRLSPMGYKGEQLLDALWKGVAVMVENDGRVTNRQAFWERFTQEVGIQALALESIFEDFYAREFDTVRSVVREKTDRGPFIRMLRECWQQTPFSRRWPWKHGWAGWVCGAVISIISPPTRTAAAASPIPATTGTFWTTSDGAGRSASWRATTRWTTWPP